MYAVCDSAHDDSGLPEVQAPWISVRHVSPLLPHRINHENPRRHVVFENERVSLAHCRRPELPVSEQRFSEPEV